ncbi:hypothetical protein KUV46_11150 [Thalassovita mediterranea]|nr:hypothetical protein KUV46_11150 [Thalassovita mediterranea]
MPKPFNPIIGPAIVGFLGASDIPEKSAAAAFRVIAAMSGLDHQRTRLFVDLLGGHTATATATYLALDTRGPKLAAIQAAARNRLSLDQYRIFARILKYQKHLEAYRDKLAHWRVWDTSCTDEHLVLQDPRKVADKKEMFSHDARFLFSVEEMEEHRALANTVAGCILRFKILLNEPQPWQGELYDALCRDLEVLAKRYPHRRQDPFHPSEWPQWLQQSPD